MFLSFYAKGFIFADGILTKLVSESKRNGVVIYKTKKLSIDKLLYVVKDKGVYAHGDTIRKALGDLKFKGMSRDITQFNNMPEDTIKTPDEWALIYRAITGACSAGVEMFVQAQGRIKAKYKLSEIIDITNGAYGYTRFREVVEGGA